MAMLRRLVINGFKSIRAMDLELRLLGLRLSQLRRLLCLLSCLLSLSALPSWWHHLTGPPWCFSADAPDLTASN